MDMVNRQLTSLTSDVATLSADVRHIKSLIHARLVTSQSPTSQCRSMVSGQSSPVIAGILKSSSSSCNAAAAASRPPHRVEFKSEPRDLRCSSSSSSLSTVVTVSDHQLSRLRRQSADLTASRRQPSSLTVNQLRTDALTHRQAASMTIPSTDL